MATATPTTVSVSFNPTAINIQSDVIGPAGTTTAGVMTAAQAAQLAALVSGAGFVMVYSPSATGAPVRPAASAVGATPVRAVTIVNFDSRQLNYAATYDGGLTYQWYDFSGALA
jgi:hypothetical protein